MNGQRLYQISNVPSGREGGFITLEDEHRVDKFVAFYPPGPVEDGEPPSRGGVRKYGVVKFVARRGGVRVISCRDLQLL